MQKLHALTSLRFVAAAMIVFHHLEGQCGTSVLRDQNFPLAHAVSFFFILSGFILMYAYPRLENWEAKKNFFFARIARIWPAHFLFFFLVGLLTLCGLMKKTGGIQEAFFNIVMIHSWIPLSKSFFSFNSPSWSISTEFFFYLCFPVIINQWSKTWKWKTLVIFSIPLILISCCAYFEVPDFSPTEQSITNIGWLHINPLARLPEFFLGIVAANIWLKYKDQFTVNLIWNSIIELTVIFFVFLNLFYYQEIMQIVGKFTPEKIAHEFKVWISAGMTTSFSFILLIFVFAQGKGIFSKFLSNRLCILLGEMSFSIYLIHQIIFRGYVSHSYLFKDMSNPIKLVVFWIFILVFSYFVLKGVEYPLRHWILRKLKTGT